MNTEQIRENMNRAGADGRPFLFALDFELTTGLFVENPLNQSDILFSTPSGSNRNLVPSVPPPSPARLEAFPEPYETYLTRFETVMSGLKRGDSFLVNLTVRTPIDTNLSLLDIFLHSNAAYSICLPRSFVCFSPERFVRIVERRITTNPMKGTISAEIPDATNTILTDTKETAEHHTIVDLMRNDLGMSADNISVEKLRYIDNIQTAKGNILQVSSEISGQLREDRLSRLGDIILSMLPAGSVSGAPKKSTLDIISRAEQTPRGFYTGIFGYFDGHQLDSAVMIRFIEQDRGQQYFRSGGGITVLSDPLSEYQEIIEKIYLPFS